MKSAPPTSETALRLSQGRKCPAQEQASGEPLPASSDCMLLAWDIYSTHLSTWIYAACGCRLCRDCVGVGAHINLNDWCLALGRRLGWKLQSLNIEGSRRKCQTDCSSSVQSSLCKSSVVRPGKTRGFPTPVSPRPRLWAW